MPTQKSQPPLQIGIIGAGWPGERHAEGYIASGQAQVVAISDLEPQRREQFSRQYQVPRTYGDYRELLADPDIEAVTVALPNFLHREATVAALTAGKHVFCEKPPAITTAEAQEMAAVARQQGLVLAYANRRRFTPAANALLAQIEAGLLGEIYHARAVWTRTWGVPQGVGGWFTDPARSGGGPLIDIGVHVLDQAWFLMGRPTPATVSGQVYHKFPALTQTEDSAFAFIRFADGRSLQLETSWVLAQGAEDASVHLYGTAGGARLDDLSLDLYAVGDYGRVQTSPRLPGGRWHDFVNQAIDFIRAVRGRAVPRTPAEDGIKLMAMLEAVYLSARQGREVVL
jgi:predicted dehydrogenase